PRAPTCAASWPTWATPTARSCVAPRSALSGSRGPASGPCRCKKRSLGSKRLIEFSGMTIQVTELNAAERRPRRVAIGTFDGVHVGHRRVIEGADTVLTFDPHPLEVLAPDAAPKLLMSFPTKRDVI